MEGAARLQHEAHGACGQPRRETNEQRRDDCSQPSSSSSLILPPSLYFPAEDAAFLKEALASVTVDQVDRMKVREPAYLVSV